ncbi:MAG: ribosomal protein S18-alanine N-acetyltransferase [Candidatus Njordarchaeia archaeon]
MVIARRRFSFRRATMDDIKEIQEIERMSFKYPYSTYYQKSLLINADIYYVVELGNRIVGYIIARKENNLGHIVSIAVHPAFRGIGIGKAMMIKAEEDLKKLGCYRVYLEVRVSNDVAIKLYKSLGYRIFRVIPRYYADGEDAYMMIKSLI